MRILDSIRTSLLGAAADDEARRAALDSLLLLLDQQRLQQEDSAFLRTALNLLSGAAVLHPSFLVPHAAPALRVLLASGKRIAADALAVLASVAESGGLEGQSHAASILGDEDLVLALASSRAVSVRARFAELLLFLTVNGQGGSVAVRPGLLLTMFLGLSKDIYPRVRSAALEGLAALCKNSCAETHNRMLKEGMYDRALPFLRDEEPEVKSAAIRLVSQWGQMLVESHTGLDARGISDAIFIQLCSVARDMVMMVRVEAFRALGNVKLVSEYVLLQSLSKKVLKIHDGENNLSEYTMHLVKESKCLLASAAGAFIHGLEDEYYEVREAACISMGKLTTFLAKFSDVALSLLVDILNDDKMVVKLRVLQVFLAMATYDRLKVQEIHMHMFLGMLVEACSAIRNAARKVLSTAILPELDMFKSSIESLFTNLELYPEDEKDVFAALFLVGRNHKKFAASFVQAHMKEMDLKIGGDLLSESAQTVALLILAISVTISSKDNTCLISREVYRYAIVFLGRIYSSLQGIIDREQLLAYLSRQSGIPYTPLDSYSKGKSKLTDSAVKSFLSHSISCHLDGQQSCIDEVGLSTDFGIGHFGSRPCQDDAGVSVSVHEQMVESGEDMQTEKRKGEEDTNKIAVDSSRLIMETLVELWKSIQPQHLPQIQQRLRSFLEELEWMAVDVDGSVKAYMIFVKEYVQAIGLAIEVWGHTVPSKLHTLGLDNLDIVLDRLDAVLRRLRFAFVGFSSEEEGQLLELNLFGCVARTCKIGLIPQPVLMRAQAVISQLKKLHEESPSNSSGFVEKVKSSCLEPWKVELHDPSFLSDVLRLFRIKQIEFTGQLRHIRAELHVPANDSENPFPFIPGLPAGITLNVKLYNMSGSHRAWVQLSAGGMIQHVYLDLVQFGVSDDVRSLVSNFPFYGAPKTPSFVIKVIVLIECPFDLDGREDNNKKGPKCRAIPLCDVKNVYMINAEK